METHLLSVHRACITRRSHQGGHNAISKGSHSLLLTVIPSFPWLGIPLDSKQVNLLRIFPV